MTKQVMAGFFSLAVVAALIAVFPGNRAGGVAALILTAGLGWYTVRGLRSLERRMYYLEGTLDAVPQPLTVTDMDMRWIFVNKTTEGLLRKTRDQVAGRHCSEWQAHICNTDKCGINSLRRGCPRTNYMQDMGNGTMHAMQVDTSYILDGQGRRIGHVEIVTDVHAQNELGDLTSKLAASLEEMTSTMTEIEAQTKANATNASEASNLASESRNVIDNEASEILHLNSAMQEITETSRQINRINKVIDEIAFQTNILALNAAVEAARAGEAGAGFAVVADEVRNLASRAAQAAKQVSELVERSTAAVAQGGTLSQRVSSSLGEVASKARSVNSLVEQIARACAEQAQGISAVTQAITHLGKVALDSADRSSPVEQLVQIRRP